MERKTMIKRRFLVLFIAVVMLCVYLVPATVQAQGTVLDSYDSSTDIGSQLLPSGKYTAQPAYRNELLFKAINYHQNRYNMTVDAVFYENEGTTEDSLRMIVAKAKDRENNNEEVTIEVVVTGEYVHVFARSSTGSQRTIRDFFRANGKVGEKNSYSVRYSNRKLWFYQNDKAIISGMNMDKYSRYTDVKPYVGLAFLFTGGSYSNLHLWGKGVEYYGAFPSMPAGNGDYADYVGIKNVQGTSTEYEGGVLKNLGVSTDVVTFTKLPFGNQDSVAWSFDLNVEKAKETYHSVRVLIRADEELKNQYKVFFTDGRVLVMYNDTEVAGAYYDRELGRTDKIGLVVKPNAVSVWINGSMVLDNVVLEKDLPLCLGVKYEFVKSTMQNMSFYYTDPVKFVAPEGDPVIPQMTAGMYNAAKYMKVLLDGKEVSYDNYTVTKVDGDGNKYSFANIPMSEDADYTLRTNMTIKSGFGKPWEGPRILFRSSKQGDCYLTFCKDSIIILQGTAELASCPMKIEIGKTYDVAINSNPDMVNVWINGKLIFSREALSETGEKTVAKAGIWFENCQATLADLKIYGKTIVLTDEVFSLELDKNVYFNSATVPEKPEGNINHFENVKVQDEKLNRRFMDNVLKIMISGKDIDYLFVDQENSRALNGLKRSDTFVWHAKVKPSQVETVEIEGQEKEGAQLGFTFKQSNHPSGSNVNYRMTLCMKDDALALEIWKDSVIIKSYENKDFALEADREYTVDILSGPSWAKVWLDNQLAFTAVDLPDYQLYFDISAVNVQAEVYDFALYNVEPNEKGKVLDVVAPIKTALAGDTLKDVQETNIPVKSWDAKTILLLVAAIGLFTAAVATVVFGAKWIQKGKLDKKEGEDEQ